MNSIFRKPSCLLHFIGFSSLSLLSGRVSALPLVPAEPMLVPDSHGGFDFIEIDQATSRLLASHTRNGTFDIFSLPDGKLEKQCQVGASQDSAVGPDGTYLVSCSAKPRLVTVDTKTLETIGETPLPGPADILCYNSKNRLAYVGHDDGDEVWAIEVATQHIVATIKVPEGPEGIVCDPENNRVYVNVRKTSEVIVIDATTNKVVANWSTAPAVSPHGLSIDLAMQRLFAAGANGKLVEMDLANGKVTGSVDIAAKVDQIAYDPEVKRVYSASGNGALSVTQAKPDALESLGENPTRKGARSVAVDFKSHAVWTAYAEGEKSYVLRLDPVK